MKTQLTLADLTGILGVGSLQFLALFFLYVRSAIQAIRSVTTVDALGFAILLTIPLIVTMYILGLLTVLLADQLLSPLYRRFTEQGRTRVLVFRSTSQMLQDYYEESERHQRLLKGSLLAFLSLVMTLYVSGGLIYIYIRGPLLALLWVFAATCPFLALRLQRQLDHLTKQLNCNSMDEQVDTSSTEPSD